MLMLFEDELPLLKCIINTADSPPVVICSTSLSLCMMNFYFFSFFFFFFLIRKTFSCHRKACLYLHKLRHRFLA